MAFKYPTGPCTSPQTLSALPQPLTPPTVNEKSLCQPQDRRRPSLRHVRHVQDSIFPDGWNCWPNCDRSKIDTNSPSSDIMPSESRGFKLFPVPPTPPIRRHHLGVQPHYSSSSESASPPSESDWLTTDLETPSSSLTPSPLIPAPLRIRKSPLSTNSSGSSQTSPCRKKGTTAFKRNSRRSSVLHQTSGFRKRFSQIHGNSSPTKHGEPRASRLSIRPIHQVHRHKRSASASNSLSQWCDVDEGLVDKRKLSVYLGGVLGSSFQMPNLDDIPDIDSFLESRKKTHLSKLRPGPLSLNPPDIDHFSSAYPDIECKCPPDVVLCHDKSSPEFRIFNRWPVFRKSQLSVSSTACRVHIPKAQFTIPPSKPRTPQLREVALSSSPPDLIYDSLLNGEDLDWSALLSSPRDDDKNNDDDVFVSYPSVDLRPSPFVQNAILSSQGKRNCSAPTVRSKAPPPSSFKLGKPSTIATATAMTTTEIDTPLGSSYSSLDFEFDFDSRKHYQRAASITSQRGPNQIGHPQYQHDGDGRSNQYHQNQLHLSKTSYPHTQVHLHSHQQATTSSEPLKPQSVTIPDLSNTTTTATISIASIARASPTKPTLITHRKGSLSPRSITFNDSINASTTNSNSSTSTTTRIQVRKPYPEITILKRRNQAVLSPTILQSNQSSTKSQFQCQPQPQSSGTTHQIRTHHYQQHHQNLKQTYSILPPPPLPPISPKYHTRSTSRITSNGSPILGRKRYIYEH